MIYNILDYGADPTGKTDSLDALRRAYEAIIAAHAGNVYFQPGKYLLDGKPTNEAAPRSGVQPPPDSASESAAEGDAPSA